MSTNPNNAVGTNAAYGGRTSVNAFNDNLATYTTGIVSGWECSPDSGLTVVLGGNGNIRDVAIAEDNSGNKTTINNISGSPISVTMDAAPGSNSRIDLVVAYVDNPPQGTSTTADNPGACGIINVTGTASSTPIEPDDNAIRSAITADGASGTTAYYVILAEITITSGTTDLTSDDIEPGDIAKLNGAGVVSSQNIDWSTLPVDYSLSEVKTGYIWIDGSEIYKKTIEIDPMPNNTSKNVAHNITNIGTYVKIESIMVSSTGKSCWSTPYVLVDSVAASETHIIVTSNSNLSAYKGYVTLYYTKSNQL